MPNEAFSTISLGPSEDGSISPEDSQHTAGILDDECVDIFETTRGACRKVSGLCQQGTCRFHLANNNPKKGPKLTHIQDFRKRCTLAFADMGGMTLQEVADAMGLTVPQVWDIEKGALRKLLARLPKDLRNFS